MGKWDDQFMASSNERWKWLTLSVTMAVATISASAVISAYFWRRKSRDVNGKVRELQISLKASLVKCVAERQGRIRAQQALRKALVKSQSEKLELTSYPMSPIAIIQSCFSTRNGTPRQPLLVPLAKAYLVFDSARVPPASLEGLEEYSHCWIIYVFHLNTNLEKLWKHPSKSKLKAKVRVPRLEGEKKGVFATRSPHRPCPIGLTVAKVEAVEGHRVLLSGVDLVDGTPVLDIKPYLPYCDSVQGATVPNWVKADNLLAVASVNFSECFSTTLADCWATVEKKSLYASPDEFQTLIRQVLSWDIRSVSQRNQPHNSLIRPEDVEAGDDNLNLDNSNDEEASDSGSKRVSLHSGDILYHLILYGLNVDYRIDCNGNVLVEKVTLPSQVRDSNKVDEVTRSEEKI